MIFQLNLEIFFLKKNLEEIRIKTIEQDEYGLWGWQAREREREREKGGLTKLFPNHYSRIYYPSKISVQRSEDVSSFLFVLSSHSFSIVSSFRLN